MTRLGVEAPQRRRKSDIFLIIMILLLFLIGVGLMVYPDVASWLASRSHAGIVDQYQQAIDELPNEELVRHFEKARVYNDSLVGGLVEDPFVAGSGFVIPDNYYEILNIHHTMGVIDIPAINVHIPIFHGTGEEVLMRGVGHIPNTPFPIGQKGKHVALTGHTGIPSSRLFTDLELLEIGDIFFLTILNERMTYQVDQINVVLPHEISNLSNIPGEDLVTLITCTPYGINSHRLLIRGHRIPYEEHMEEEIEVIVMHYLNWRVLLSVGVSLIFFIGWLVYFIRNQKKDPVNNM